MAEPSARRQARIASWLLAAPTVAAAMLVAAATTATLALRIRVPSADRLVDACRALLPRIGLRPSLDLLATGLGLIVITRAAPLVSRELRSLRRYHSSVKGSRPFRIDATEVWIVDDARPLAFTAGWFRPRIHLSTATVRRLNRDQLAAVITHEDRHRRHRDPLRLAAARVTAGALPFLPPVGVLADRHAGAVELAADEHAVRTCGVQPLAGALLRLGTANDECRIVPERIDHLAGRPSAGLGLGRTVVVALLALAASLIGLETIESAGSIDVVLLAVQLCTVGAIGIAITLAVLVRAVRRQSLPSVIRG